MKGDRLRKKPFLPRREFVSHTFKLLALGSLVVPLAEACKSKKKEAALPGTDSGGKPKNPSKPTSKSPRKKWSRESLVVNNKTHVLHFPTSKMYTYYDEIKATHLQPLGFAGWAAQLKEPVRLHKQQSGNILEILSLRELQAGINDMSLQAASESLALAFGNACDNSKGFNLNSTNFRIHELLLQLVSLNNGIPPAEKWAYFSSRVKKPAQLRKRQQWMESEDRFMERVNYIVNRKDEYITRLNRRAAKYMFT